MQKSHLLLTVGVICFATALLLTAIQFPNGYTHMVYWIRNAGFWHKYLLTMSLTITLYMAAFCCVVLAYVFDPPNNL